MRFHTDSLVSTTLLLLGLVMLAIALYSAGSALRLPGKTVKTEGTVVELHEPASPGGAGEFISGIIAPSRLPVVRFVTGEGRTIEFTARTGLNPPQFSQGDTVSVAYRPGNPQDARIDGLFLLWGIELILAAVGGMFTLFGMGTLLLPVMLSRRARYLRDHGMPVQTEFVRAVRHPWLVVNRLQPFVVETRWRNPATAEIRVFRSNAVMFDPTAQIKARSITVFIDRDHPGKYHVDLSFLTAHDGTA